MIIDFHAHIYPEKIAEKARKSIQTFYDEVPMSGNGSIAGLLESGSKIGVEKYIVHSTATKPEQVISINNFIIEAAKNEPRFIGFGTMHPGFADFESEIERIKNANLKGVKIHPDFQKFQADAEVMDPIYDCLAQNNMPVLFHAGDYRYDFSGPLRMLNVHKKHPNLKVVAAHFGGYTEWEKSYQILCGSGVYFDTSSTLWKLPVEQAQKMIAKHGIEKFLFGSDYPMWNHVEELGRIKKLGLTDSELEMVLYKNAVSLLEL